MSQNTQQAPKKTTESNDDSIKLMSIKELIGMKFYIPSYQRGYRWTPRQVKDLLDDIWEFLLNRQKDSTSFYCLQPLVVTSRKIKKMEFNSEIARLSNLKDDDDIRATDIRKAIDELTQWEVIDGQQRLTTIKIILAYLRHDKSYSIEYETRKAENNSCHIGSRDFLDKIADYAKEDDNRDKKVPNSNIDFFHMYQAWETLSDWWSNKETTLKWSDDQKKSERKNFLETLLNNVHVIWYYAKGEDPIEVFTRLNIGKISLTNAELIKALFLKRSNWQGKTSDSLSLSQLEIASQWDNIEYTLQNDEFWMFFHDEDAPPTRIDYIFNYICEKNRLYDADHANGQNRAEIIGSDNYRTFRYFYNYFKAAKTTSDADNQEDKKNPIEKCWDEVKRIFGTLLEWYNDCELYHYVGFLTTVHEKEKKNTNDYTMDFLSKWLNKETRTKADFLNDYVKKEIKFAIKDCNCLTAEYDIDNHNAKSNCSPLLLLFNVQTVINQNKGYKGNEQYKLGVFYKFPFHLYKKEKWDIEHIDSNTTNELDKSKDPKDWVLNALYALYCAHGKKTEPRETSQAVITPKSAISGSNEEVIGELNFNAIGQVIDGNKICNFLSGQENKKETFSEIRGRLSELLGEQSSDWSANEKNQIWNFALLDSGTNRSYHNDIFPTKRRKLIAKDQGKTISLEWKGKDHAVIVKTETAEIAFVPPCTKNAFLKYYTPGNNDLWKWNRRDAGNYRQAIYDTLKEFGVTIGADDKN